MMLVDNDEEDKGFTKETATKVSSQQLCKNIVLFKTDCVLKTERGMNNEKRLQLKKQKTG